MTRPRARHAWGTAAATVILVPAASAGAETRPSPSVRPGKTVVAGYVETVRLYPGGHPIAAKLDTGANTSSLHSPRMVPFRRNGTRWVRFTLRLGGRDVVLERPVIRISRVRRADAPPAVRPVVHLTLCLAGHRRRTEVSLTDRRHLRYPLLVGRRFLTAARILVDSGKQYLTRADCPAPEGSRPPAGHPQNPQPRPAR